VKKGNPSVEQNQEAIIRREERERKRTLIVDTYLCAAQANCSDQYSTQFVCGFILIFHNIFKMFLCVYSISLLSNMTFSEMRSLDNIDTLI
jgi:hypothetical protein